MQAIESAPEYTADIAGFEKRQVKRNARNPGREADHQEATFPVHGAERWLCIIAANSVINDVDAATAHFLDLV